MFSGKLAFFGLLAMVTLPLESSLPAVPFVETAGRLKTFPRVTVWSWSRHEDLSSIDPATTAVAALDRTLFLEGPVLRVVPQRNALVVPAAPNLHRMSVVRIQTRQPHLTPETAVAVAKASVAALRPGMEALQIDFDAVRSERVWYRQVLEEIRARLPSGTPLSITALASWCSHDRWMTGLPVDEAVPMFFRMEPGNHNTDDPDLKVREPLCMGAAGISTREPWPRGLQRRRVYVFADRGWRRDGVRQTAGDLQ